MLALTIYFVISATASLWIIVNGGRKWLLCCAALCFTSAFMFLLLVLLDGILEIGSFSEGIEWAILATAITSCSLGVALSGPVLVVAVRRLKAKERGRGK